MIGSHRVEGYAIVSADGMIADRDGKMPETFRTTPINDFCKGRWTGRRDRARASLPRRRSRAGTRKRIIVTRQIAAVAPDRTYPNAVLWNPAGAALEQAMAALDVGDGIIALIGGTEIFGCFLPLYDAFHLTRGANAHMPADGRCFRKSARTRRRRMCSRAAACAPDGRATSMPPPPSRSRPLSACANDPLSRKQKVCHIDAMTLADTMPPQ